MIGYLFDLDGVLIDSEREYTRIWEEIDRKYPSGIEDFALVIKGQTLQKILVENYPDAIREDVKCELHRLEQEMTYSYCEGAERLLDRMNRRGSKIAVVTSSDEMKMSHLYENLPEFRKKISVIIDASRVKKSKPDPEGYCKGAQALNVPIKNCVVFEDSIQGAKAGQLAGAYVIGITGTKTRTELEPYSNLVIDSLEELDIDHISSIVSKR